MNWTKVIASFVLAAIWLAANIAPSTAQQPKFPAEFWGAWCAWNKDPRWMEEKRNPRLWIAEPGKCKVGPGPVTYDIFPTHFYNPELNDGCTPLKIMPFGNPLAPVYRMQVHCLISYANKPTITDLEWTRVKNTIEMRGWKDCAYCLKE